MQNVTLFDRCVVDADDFYNIFVTVQTKQGADETLTETVLGYKLAESERLIDAQPPLTKAYAGGVGFVKPRWDDDAETWVEGASAEELAAWETEHPDPISFEQYKKKKLEELSQSCSNIINNGLSIQLSNGSTQSFSYSLEKGDQNNIKEMFDAVCMGAEGFVYHQNDGGCIFYSAQDVLIIYKALSMLKISNTTYYNQLKQYVNSLSNLDEIKAVEYGQELTGEYLQTYNARMQEAEAQFDLIINKLIQSQTI